MITAHSAICFLYWTKFIALSDRMCVFLSLTEWRLEPALLCSILVGCQNQSNTLPAEDGLVVRSHTS